MTGLPMTPQAPGSPTDTIAWADAARHAAFEQWFDSLAAAHGLQRETLAPASADASFRRYFRVQSAHGSRIIMDAPPPQEDVRPFVDIAGRIARAGLHGPEVLAADVAQGFLLLSDLGSRLMLETLRQADTARADALMRGAVQALVTWQQRVDASGLPPYDEALLRREMQLFPDWCVAREYGASWSAKQAATWDRITGLLVHSALAQPRVAVHRDWMPRNLMVGPAGDDTAPRILDFQDAVLGPVTYDVASLLRDAFLSWDEAQELDWAVRWWQAAREAGVLADHPMAEDFGECWRALEWMGLQRHLKVLGIFCRLKHRDGKPRYAEDLPRFFGYAARVALRYRELAPLVELLEQLAGPLRVQAYSLR
jgi:N-acetylmuramate 1-kinase